MAAAGSKVIVDDLGYLNEPFFQDGIIAQAVNDVTAAGVTYVSAAGNDQDLSYEAAFNPSGSFQNFDPNGGPDTRQGITVPSGYANTLVLQWDDPYYTTSGVTHDFDVKVYNSGGSVVASGTTNNISTQFPYEIVSWNTSGSGNVPYDIEIERKAGSGASVLKYILFSGTAATVTEFATDSSTVFGQPAAANAIAVGAVPWYSPTTIEPYSSRGDVTIYFDPAGNRLSNSEVRHKPDVVAPDGVNTTFFGSDIPQDADTFPNFFGTSAAAPHVAGVAALILDGNPHLTQQELRDVLLNTAVDLGDPGLDRVYGYGLVDAEAALLAAQALPDVTAPTAQLVSPIAVDGWHVDQLTIRFSEPLDAATAANSANYSLVWLAPTPHSALATTSRSRSIPSTTMTLGRFR